MRVKMDDKQRETISAICEYENVLKIIETIPTSIKEEHDRLASPRSAKLDGMPRVRNPQAGEERLVAGLDRINAMKDRYEKAVIFIQWFEPPWKMLSEFERDLLETYKYSDCNCGAVRTLAGQYGFTERNTFRVRLKALSRLTALLFGDF